MKGKCVFSPNDGLMEEGGSVGLWVVVDILVKLVPIEIFVSSSMFLDFSWTMFLYSHLCARLFSLISLPIHQFYS